MCKALQAEDLRYLLFQAPSPRGDVRGHPEGERRRDRPHPPPLRVSSDQPEDAAPKWCHYLQRVLGMDWESTLPAPVDLEPESPYPGRWHPYQKACKWHGMELHQGTVYRAFPDSSNPPEF